jgi:hypothetical protein
LDVEKCLGGFIHGIVLDNYEGDIVILFVFVSHPCGEIDRDFAKYILSGLGIKTYDRLDDAINREEESILL